MKKRFLCLALALGLCLGLCPARAAEDTGFSDVKEADWFAPYVSICVEHGLMQGTDRGFEPQKILTQAECVTLAARVGAALKGESVPAAQPGEEWWIPYEEYVLGGRLLAGPTDFAARIQFVSLLDQVLPNDRLEPINVIDAIPDNDPTLPLSEYGDMALRFYRAGILTGRDSYGSFGPTYSLTRAEAAAMVSRIVEPSLRLTFTPADYSPFLAAYLTPDTVMFENGIIAEQFLAEVNRRIFQAEEGSLRSGHPFNWHSMDVNGKTTLENTKASVLENLGVTEKQGTQAYKDFDYQVYYSRLIDLTGETLEPDYAVGVGA